jgi:hypothetical protein
MGPGRTLFSNTSGPITPVGQMTVDAESLMNWIAFITMKTD